MIEARDLIKVYGDVTAVYIPHIKIEKGESFGLVGNNGAGKTTLFRLILDLIRPEGGFVMSGEHYVMQNDDWKKYTGSYLDEGFLIDFLTPEEYFEFIGNVHGLTDGDLADFYAEFDEFFDGEILGKEKLIRELSKGNQKKIGIAAALMQKPEVLVLDEPFASLDPTTQIRLKNLLGKLRDDKEITMLISSHDLNHVTEVCERIVILEKGLIVHDLKTSGDTLRKLEEYFRR